MRDINQQPVEVKEIKPAAEQGRAGIPPIGNTP